MDNVGLKHKSTCCGCGTCAAICPKSCISMTSDEEGFMYPSVDESLCVNCGLCLKICTWEHPIKKEPRHVYAIKAKDINVRYQSSSGGAFDVIARFLLNKGYVVYGAAYSDDFSEVNHIMIKTASDLPLLRGSKYVQSNMTDVFTEIHSLLISGEKVLFSGTGCQVSALKLFLKKDFDSLITIDILCHGVPSPLLFRLYIKNVKEKYGHISTINMKDKTNGWGHQQLRMIATKNVSTDVQNLWYKIFYSRIALRPSCYECIFMDIARAGDISIGDYWGIENVNGSFLDKRGVSLLLSNSEKGHQIFESVKKYFEVLETTVEDCYQPVLKGPEPSPEWRFSFWNTFYQIGFNETVYRFWNVTFGNKLIYRFQRIVKRIFR